MSADRRIREDIEFLTICVASDLLKETDAESLRETIGGDHPIASQAVLQRGLLTPADVDIVQSLQYPTSVVPGYKILESVGRGGMGVVYRAEQIDLEKIVALKTILISNVHDPTIAARFEREAKSLARLQHPNIVQALNFGKHHGRYYFAMEFVAGQTCEQVLKRVFAMQRPRAWSVVRQVASGLMHALKQNLIHRDIKPANLLLLPPPEGATSQSEVVKIADFGLAMFADQSPDQLKLTTGEKVLGSPTYMSLEQFGGRDLDFRSDVYSLGATAWHLLFGKPPFQGGSVPALFEQKSRPLSVDASTLTLALPDEQLRLLVSMLDPDPDRRPQSYEQLINIIDQFDNRGAEPPAKGRRLIEPGPVSSDPMASTLELPLVSANEQVVPKSRKIGWRIATAALVGLIALVAAAGWLSRRAEPRGQRSHTRVVGMTPLYDGVTLSGWDVGGSMVGAWNTVEDPDGSTAIACTSRKGALTRRFPKTANARISLFVWLGPKSGPVDIDFAIDSADPSDVRGSLRMSSSSNQVGEKRSDFEKLAVTFQSDALPSMHDRYHVVHIERQPTDWFVFLEDKLVGTLPIDRVGDGDSIRLVVHDSNSEVAESKSFFADVQLDELREKTSTE